MVYLFTSVYLTSLQYPIVRIAYLKDCRPDRPVPYRPVPYRPVKCFKRGTLETKIRLEPKIENRSDLDFDPMSSTQLSQIFGWEWSGGMKMATKGKPKFPTFCKNLKYYKNNDF